MYEIMINRNVATKFFKYIKLPSLYIVMIPRSSSSFAKFCHIYRGFHGRNFEP